MLALDKTLNCIEADESELLAVYQSEKPVTAAPAGINPEPCEAYACAVRKGSQVSVYVALITNAKKIFIYTPEKQANRNEPYEKVLRKAISFASSMGFVMESVNLSCSAAMRTVVVRNIKVLRPPGTAGKTPPNQKLANGQGLDEQSPPAESIPVELASAAVPLATVPAIEPIRVPEPPPTETQERVAGILALRGEIARRADANPPAPLPEGQMAAALTQLLEQAKSKNEAATRQLHQELATLRSELSGMATEREEERKRHGEEISLLRGKIEALAEAKETAESRAGELSDLLRQKFEELATAKADAERAAKEKAEMVLAMGEESLLRGRVEALIEAKETAEARAEELSDLLRQSFEEVAAAKADAERAATEKAEMVSVMEAEANQAKVATASLAAMQKEMARLAITNTSIEKRLAELIGEKSALDKEAASLKSEIERLIATNAESERRVTELTKDNLNLAGQLESLIDALRNEPPSQVIEPPLPSLGPEPAPAPEYDMGQISGHEDSVFFSQFCNGSDATPIAFVIDKNLSAIEYANHEDVLVLHHSFNTARVSLDGGRLENSSAFICSVKDGETFRVMVGLFLIESRKTLVYRPEFQPTGDDSLARTIQSAMEFVETVGFMMGEDELGDDPVIRQEKLARVPVLKQRGQSS